MSPAQAGDRVECKCGRLLDVPPLRELQSLPQAASEIDTGGKAWGVRQGLIAASLIVAVLCAIPGVYWWLQPKTPIYPVEAQLDASAQLIDALSPLQTWYTWHQQIVPLAERGLEEFRTPDSIAQERQWAKLRLYEKIAFGIAGSAILFSITAALWSRAAS